MNIEKFSIQDIIIPSNLQKHVFLDEMLQGITEKDDVIKTIVDYIINNFSRDSNREICDLLNTFIRYRPKKSLLYCKVFQQLIINNFVDIKEWVTQGKAEESPLIYYLYKNGCINKEFVIYLQKYCNWIANYFPNIDSSDPSLEIDCEVEYKNEHYYEKDTIEDLIARDEVDRLRIIPNFLPHYGERNFFDAQNPLILAYYFESEKVIKKILDESSNKDKQLMASQFTSILIKQHRNKEITEISADISRLQIASKSLNYQVVLFCADQYRKKNQKYNGCLIYSDCPELYDSIKDIVDMPKIFEICASNGYNRLFNVAKAEKKYYMDYSTIFSIAVQNNNLGLIKILRDYVNPKEVNPRSIVRSQNPDLINLFTNEYGYKWRSYDIEEAFSCADSEEVCMALLQIPKLRNKQQLKRIQFLPVAAQKGWDNLVMYMLNDLKMSPSGYKNELSVIRPYIENDDLKMVKNIISTIRAGKEGLFVDKEGALQDAVELGKLDIVEYFISIGADVNLIDPYGIALDTKPFPSIIAALEAAGCHHFKNGELAEPAEIPKKRRRRRMMLWDLDSDY